MARFAEWWPKAVALNTDWEAAKFRGPGCASLREFELDFRVGDGDDKGRRAFLHGWTSRGVLTSLSWGARQHPPPPPPTFASNNYYPPPQSAPVAQIEFFETHGAKDSLILVAFQSTGAAAPIAAQYLIRHLELPLVGHILSNNLPGLMAVHNGRATAPIHIFGGAVTCKLDGDCPNIYIVTSQIPLPPEAIAEVSDALLEWCDENRTKMTIVLDAVVKQDDDAAPNVFLAGSDQKARNSLQSSGIQLAAQALVGGVAAFTLLGAPKRALTAAAILVEAVKGKPDGRAAAALVEALDEILPNIPMDHEPLLKEAMEMEHQMAAAEEFVQDFKPAKNPGTFI